MGRSASRNLRWSPWVYQASTVLFVFMTGYAVWELAQGGRGPGPWLRAFAWTVLAIGSFANWRAGLRLNVAGASEISGE